MAATIEIVIPRNGLRRWQALVIERLRGRGHDVALRHAETRSPWHWAFDLALRLEGRFAVRRTCGLMQTVAARAATPPSAPPTLRLDLTGLAPADTTPTLALVFDGQSTARGALDCLVHGKLPTLDIKLDGTIVASALPMIDNHASIAAGLDDVLARAITLAVATTGRVASGAQLEPLTSNAVPAPRASFTRYVAAFTSLVVRESRRRSLFRFAHWHTGYRLAGDTAWHELPEDGSRFFADPFPFTVDGRHYIFVEDFDHAKGKGVISMSEVDTAGFATTPRTVIEEPTHLSYPQVFAEGGEIWMIPESSAAREVVLYRAEHFPDRWVRHAVLIADAEISDATLLVRDGRYWLFGTLRDGHGSTSDTLVVYHAPALTGPWIAHVANPVRIDRTAARPAGAFFERDGRTWLPVQDGTRGYGSGIGLIELLELDLTTVRVGPRQRLSSPDAPLPPAVHTFNRHADLEVIDWKIAEPRYRGAWAITPIARPQRSNASLPTTISPAE